MASPFCRTGHTTCSQLLVIKIDMSSSPNDFWNWPCPCLRRWEEHSTPNTGTGNRHGPTQQRIMEFSVQCVDTATCKCSDCDQRSQSPIKYLDISSSIWRKDSSSFWSFLSTATTTIIVMHCKLFYCINSMQMKKIIVNGSILKENVPLYY